MHMPLRADRLREMREQLGLTQRELADLCGITLYQISRYENEKSDITATSLQLLAQNLHVSVDYLLGLSDDPQGRIDPTGLSEDERIMLETFRRESWPGVIRLIGERISK